VACIVGALDCPSVVRLETVTHGESRKGVTSDKLEVDNLFRENYRGKTCVLKIQKGGSPKKKATNDE
jgi:hypothetical protein